MKMSTRQDIEAPIAHVFDCVTDFAGFERLMMRRGADVRRTSPATGLIGTQWDVAFDYRGRTRRLKAELVACEAPGGLTMTAVVGGLNGTTVVDLLPLSRQRTRMTLTIEVRASTITARLLIQSARLGRSRMLRKLGKRLEVFGRTVEERFAPVTMPPRG